MAKAKTAPKQVTAAEAVPVLLGVLVIVVPMIFYFMVYADLETQENNARNNIITLQKEIHQLQKQSEQYEMLKEERANLKRNIDKLQSKLPATTDAFLHDHQMLRREFLDGGVALERELVDHGLAALFQCLTNQTLKLLAKSRIVLKSLLHLWFQVHLGYLQVETVLVELEREGLPFLLVDAFHRYGEGYHAHVGVVDVAPDVQRERVVGIVGDGAEHRFLVTVAEICHP